MMSGILFGFGILAKENAIFFLPFFLYCIYLYTDKRQRNFAFATWLSLAAIVTALYFLYALIKGELFPAGSLLGGSTPHVSLLGTLKDQLSRSGGGMLDLNKSSFWVSTRSWLELDPMIMILGGISTVINLYIGNPFNRAASYHKKILWLAGLFSISFWIFLIRGGLVIEFYSIPLFPILALNIAATTWYFGIQLQKKFMIDILRFAPALVMTVLFIATSWYFGNNVRNIQSLFTSDQTTPQIQAIDWIITRTNPGSFFVIDNYGYIDLHEKGKGKFKNAEWYWKVDRDPEISRNILKGTAAGIDYVALTPQMEHDITESGLDLTKAAWNKSQPVARFWNDGWGVQFFATKFDSRILRTSWIHYKDRFVQDGRTVDSYENNATTSEGQSYTLLRSVWMNDRKTFDEVWAWTKTNLQQADGVFAWRFNPQNSTVDTGTASDADSDIALALLFAYKRWNEAEYLTEALKIMDGIWSHEVVTLNGLPYMTAANWANHDTTLTINPSYLSPASYRVFASADSSHAWIRLADTSYWLLKKCTTAKLDKEAGVLPPDWCSIDKKTFEADQPGEFQPRATEYSSTAFRVPWRVAPDYAWFKAPEAKLYLSTLTVLSDEYRKNKKLSTAYSHDGKVWEAYESAAAYGGNIGYFAVMAPSVAKEIYNNKLLAKYYEDENDAYWEEPKNYYTQNWAWLGTALYTNNLPNLWDR